MKVTWERLQNVERTLYLHNDGGGNRPADHYDEALVLEIERMRSELDGARSFIALFKNNDISAREYLEHIDAALKM